MLPITVIVSVLAIAFTSMPTNTVVKFIVGSLLLVVGTALFTLGAEVAMKPMGDLLGEFMAKKSKLWLWATMGLILGVIITITEPGLLLLGGMAEEIPGVTLIITVALGVGVFLAIAFLREILRIKLSYILLGFYALIFAFAFFVPEEFLPIAFDSGGITMGAMTVPFIMALGVGIAAAKQKQSGKVSADSNFGLVAICSIGPIITVMVLGLIFTPSGASAEVSRFESTETALSAYLSAFPIYTLETLIALAPIAVFFLIFCVAILKSKRQQTLGIFRGVLYTFVGLSLFLVGANVGFLPAGHYIGGYIANSEIGWILVVAGMVFGFFIITAEPAVSILNKQVEDITGGAISRRAMGLSLSIGVALSVGISMLRIITGLPIIWILLPSYIISVGLAFVVPKIFTAIAFDSGGVAAGPLGSAFLLPLAIGASTAVGGNIVTDAFGIMAMVAMTPLITIQIMGLYFKVFREKRADKKD